MSLEQLLAENTAALIANTQALQVLEAGRQASLEQLKKAAETGDAPKPTRRKKADEAPAAAAEEATVTQTVTEGAVSAPTTTAPAATESIEQQVRAETTAYVNAEGLTDDQKTARTDNIRAIMAHFGGMLCGPTSTLDDEQRSQALFYIRRFAAGCTVDFSQDYDFSGDPAQGGLDAAEPAAAAADEFDIG
jgi:hypothetical protein